MIHRQRLGHTNEDCDALFQLILEEDNNLPELCAVDSDTDLDSSLATSQEERYEDKHMLYNALRKDFHAKRDQRLKKLNRLSDVVFKFDDYEDKIEFKWTSSVVSTIINMKMEPSTNIAYKAHLYALDMMQPCIDAGQDHEAEVWSGGEIPVIYKYQLQRKKAQPRRMKRLDSRKRWNGRFPLICKLQYAKRKRLLHDQLRQTDFIELDPYRPIIGPPTSLFETYYPRVVIAGSVSNLQNAPNTLVISYVLCRVFTTALLKFPSYPR
jgi:hypothetical protein